MAAKACRLSAGQRTWDRFGHGEAGTAGGSWMRWTGRRKLYRCCHASLQTQMSRPASSATTHNAEHPFDAVLPKHAISTTTSEPRAVPRASIPRDAET